MTQKKDDIERLKEVLTAGHVCVSMTTNEEQYALDIIRCVAMDVEREMWIWSVAGGVCEGLITGSPYLPNTDSPVCGLAKFYGLQENAICVTLDLVPHLRRDNKALRLLRDIISDREQSKKNLLMVDSSSDLPDVIKAYATPFELSYPDEKELYEIIRHTLAHLNRSKPIEVGITKRGMDAIVRNLRGLTRRQAEQIIADTVANDQRFDDDDINVVIASKRRMIQRGGLLEYIQTPLDMDEIGGMRRLKKWLANRTGAFSDEAREFGLSAPRGVLMLGVQGAGKSLCAKAIATAWHQPLLKLDPSSLYASFIGESERNLRDALRQTEMMSPVILWIDEIEKAFASAASRSADGGLSQRMFGTLLTWLQERDAPVFVVATANDIEALPPELLRKGRFDEIFFVDLPDPAVREMIFSIHLKKRHRNPEDFQLKTLAEASEGYSGAEIEQAVISAMHVAYAENKPLNTAIIVDALAESPPLSVTMAESVESLRLWAKDRCVSAD